MSRLRFRLTSVLRVCQGPLKTGRLRHLEGKVIFCFSIIKNDKVNDFYCAFNLLEKLPEEYSQNESFTAFKTGIW